MSSTDLTTQDQAAVEAILRQQEDEFAGDARLQTPILKITQSLTTEVKAGDVEAGEFYNTLTDESYGTAVEFIVAAAQRGRAMSLKDGRYFVAISQDTIPESWTDAVGTEYVGTPFAEHPDAEEQYKARVNAGDIEWGGGPPISTTYNYTGWVFPPAVEGEDDFEPAPLPVRIAFLRSTRSAHDKLQTLRRSLLRNKPFWDVVFELKTKPKSFGRHEAFIVEVRKTRVTTPEEKALASELAVAVLSGDVADNAETAMADDNKREAPAPTGGLEV